MTDFKVITTRSGRTIRVVTTPAKPLPAPETTGHRRCRHVGDTIGDTQCRTCQGAAALPTRLCQLHNVPCVTAMREPLASDVRWCRVCGDHQP